MTTSLAFVPAVATPRKSCSAVRLAPPTPPTAEAALREPHVDILWRLTTRPWAQVRAKTTPPAVPRVIALLETGLLGVTALGMAVLTMLALAA